MKLSSTSFLALTALIAGCAEQTTSDRERVTRHEVQVLADDCDGNYVGKRQVDSHILGASKLHVIGIGQAREVAPSSRQEGCRTCLEPKPDPARVHVGRGVTTLVLTSPLETAWTVTMDPDAELERVIVSGIPGFNHSTAVVPDGVSHERLDLDYAYVHHDEADLAQTCEETTGDPLLCSDLGAFWYEHRQSEAEIGARFLAGVEQALGEVGSFRGCMVMSSMTIGIPQRRDPGVVSHDLTMRGPIESR